MQSEEGRWRLAECDGLVARQASQAQVIADLVDAGHRLGFKVHVSQVDQSVMYAKYCEVPKEEVDLCPSGGWVRDFADPLTVLSGDREAVGG